MKFYNVENMGVTMSKQDFLGSFEQLVLLAVLRLGDNAYGMMVRRELEERTGRSVSLGAVYATLERLEEKGHVKSRRGKPTPGRQGRAKRYFRVELSGRAALQHAFEGLERMREGLQGFSKPVGECG